MFKNGVLLISLIYTIALAVVCLIKINNLPSIGITFADKIFHFITYSVLTFLWVNTFFFRFKYQKIKSIFYAAICSVIFGIVIEVLQGSLVARETDVYDAIANTLGVLFMVIILLINKKTYIKKL